MASISRFLTNSMFRIDYAVHYGRIGIPIVFMVPCFLIIVASGYILLLIFRRRQDRIKRKLLEKIYNNSLKRLLFSNIG